MCEQWSLTERLDHEKEVTGIFMSGHPLDHFKFELKYYGIMQIADFNEVKESTTLVNANLGKTFRLAGLVIDAQHRVTRTGRNFGSLTIEDFSGKTELMLWSDDYVRFQNYIEKGKNLLVHGNFKQRYNSEQFEFKVTGICLLETAKQMLTKNLDLKLEPASLTSEFVQFMEKNVKSNPGKSSLKFHIYEPTENLQVSLYSLEKGFTMNEQLADF